MELSAAASTIRRRPIAFCTPLHAGLAAIWKRFARFRPDLTLLAELAQIEGEDDFPLLGQVPPEWAETRVVGSEFHYGSYADIYASEWIGIPRQELAGFCIALGYPELDAAALQQPTSRPLTQRVSRVVFNNGFDGITAPGSATMYAIGRFSSRSTSII
jgi:hypothetical protein